MRVACRRITARYQRIAASGSFGTRDARGILLIELLSADRRHFRMKHVVTSSRKCRIERIKVGWTCLARRKRNRSFRPFILLGRTFSHIASPPHKSVTGNSLDTIKNCFQMGSDVSQKRKSQIARMIVNFYYITRTDKSSDIFIPRRLLLFDKRYEYLASHIYHGES